MANIIFSIIAFIILDIIITCVAIQEFKRRKITHTSRDTCPFCGTHLEWVETDALVKHRNTYLIPCPGCEKIIAVHKEEDHDSR